ncbi:SCAR homolog 2 [Actinidia rufa]|uniref:Protein SCAR n=1 Tax=Actinidia rufa TaxID=165716 RepID=A0A7J0FBE8_9ERIC|nr:SCAR homolog 2 [Actinidia rufa]
MPLTRHQIRNEYSLADPELYRAADKDDPEALLEGVAMAGLVGVLRQLGDLAEFAAEIFHNLHEDVMATAARGHGLVIRVQQLEAEFSSIEKAFLSQTSHSLFFYNDGTVWHPTMRTDQNLIAQGDLPRFVMDSYEECRGPPRLFLLDKFDVAGAGACLKRYTDPSFFKVNSSSSGMMNAEVQREKKTRKAKKKGSRWRNGETPEVIPASNAKLHQLLLVESVENLVNDPARRVKLKRRLNGFPFDSKTGKSYMEKFLKITTAGHNTVHEISGDSSPLKLPYNTTGEPGVEILEISTVNPEKDLQKRKRSPCSSPDVEVTGQKPSMDELGEEVDYGISELPEPNPDSEADIFLSKLHEEVYEKEIMMDGERKREGSADGYQSEDISSEVENYMDARTTTDSEMETDSECRAKNDLRLLTIENQRMMCSDESEKQQDLQVQFSDSQSIGNSTAMNDGNNCSGKGIYSFSYSDSISNLAENTPSDSDVSAKNLQSTESCEADIVNLSSKQCSVHGESPLIQPLDHEVCNDVWAEEAKFRSDTPEFGEPSSGSCRTDSAAMLLPVDPGKSSSEDAPVGLELDELSSNHNEHSTDHINHEENRTHSDDLPCTSNSSAVRSQTKDQVLPEFSADNHPGDELDDEDPHVLSHASLHLSNISELAPANESSENFLDDVLQAECAEDKCLKSSVDVKMGSPESVASQLEVQPPDSALPELETCEPDVKTDGMGPEVDDAPSLSGEVSVSSTPIAESPKASNFTKQQFQEITENVPPLEPDSVEVGSSYSSEGNHNGDIEISSTPAVDSPKARNFTKKEILEITENVPPLEPDSSEVGFSYSSEGILDAASNGEELCEFSSDMDVVGNDVVHLKFPSDFQNSSNLPPVPEDHVHLDDVVTETNHSEAIIVANALTGTHCDDEKDHEKSLSASPTKLREEPISFLQDLHENGLAIDAACSPEHLQESGAEEVVYQEAVVAVDLDSVRSNTVCCDDSRSALLNNGSDSSMDGISRNSDGRSSSTSPTKLQEESISVLHGLPQNGLATDESYSMEHLQEAGTEKEADKQAVASSDLDSVTIDTVSCDESKSEMLNVPDSSMYGISRNNLHIVDATSVPLSLDQNIHNSEPKSPQQINMIENIDDDASSPSHHIAAPRFSVERMVELQADQFDVESQHSSKGSSKSLFQAENIQSPDHLDQEGQIDASSEFCAAQLPSQPSVSELLPQLDVSERATHPSNNSIFPSFGLLPDASQINLDEMPPLPPLPPMQWRMGKVQHASLAPDRYSVRQNVDPFPQILPSIADEKAQLGHVAIEEERTQPSHPSSLQSAVKDRNSQHGYENSEGYHVPAIQLSLLVPTMVNHGNGEDDFPTSDRTLSTNPFLVMPTIFQERSHHGFVVSEQGTAHLTSNPFSPVTSVEDTVPTYPIRLLSSEDDNLPFAPEDGEPNGNGKMKLPRPRNPLIDAVAAHDKNTLKKVTDRVRPQIGQELDERDSLLEQIRTKSFNLKPAVVTRPSIQGPKTNLKMAAILEKANAIRQAWAGSDEDDDADGWSDS